MSHVLAVDLGSSGVKVAVVDREGAVVASRSQPLPTVFLPGGGAEQDAHGWWDAVGACSRGALSDVPGAFVEAVAVTAQWMSIIAVDDRGLPLRDVVMWMDRRGAPHLRAQAGGAIDVGLWFERHGFAPIGACDQAHIAWIRANEPEVHEAAAAFVEPVDHLNARLTGRVTANQGTAFPLMTVDNRTHGATEHDPELVSRIGVEPSKLPPLVPFDEILGKVTPEAAEHLGITTDAVVVTGTIDSITSSVGCGVIDASDCAVIIGTTTVIVTHIDRKDADHEHGLLSVPSPLPGKWFVMAENGVGGKALEFHVRTVLDGTYEDAEAMAMAAPPGSGGAIFLPWLIGSLAPGNDRNQRGGYLNLGLETTRAELTRAVYEGVACNAAWLLPHVAAFAGASWESVRFGGGGASSDLWAQVLADCTGMAVDQLDGPRTTNARGAAFLALARLGHITIDDIPSLVRVTRRFEPDPAARATYGPMVERLAELHAALAPFAAAVNGRTPR